MKKHIYKFLTLLTFVTVFVSCDGDWMERKPKNLVTDDQVWNDPKQILGLLANYYDRIATLSGLEDREDSRYDDKKARIMQWRNMADFDDAMWSGYDGENYRNVRTEYNYDYARLWDYELLRDINLSIENLKEFGTELNQEQKDQFVNEFRFIRAYSYFELVKRMGGVPIIDSQLIYNYDGDPTPLQVPRAKEHEVYDFIAKEMDEIKDHLGNETSITRANKYIALALKSKAMLYAGSLAKYNNEMPVPITTANGEVGIPAGMATAYYQKSLEASREILSSGQYALFDGDPTNAGENFYKMLMTKNNNKEMIWVKDYLASKDKRHAFAYDNIARGVREDNLASSSMVPTLNLVESFDYLDGSPGVLKTHTADGSDYIYYDNLSDIFANKDPRLYGTVVYPGTTFRGVEVQIQAGVKVWNGSDYDTFEGRELGENYTDGKLLTGTSGPHRTIMEVSCTGFYFRKFISDSPGASTRGIRSDNWWAFFRLGEIYLNAAEAALELGDEPTARGYVNALREARGFAPNSIPTLTTEKLRNERRVELAFEDHRFFDAKRWRIAHQIWNGQPTNTNSVLYALYPYRVIRPGHPTDGKYVFEKMVAPRFDSGRPRYFRMGNYYSSIDQGVLNNNPKLVRNPFH